MAVLVCGRRGNRVTTATATAPSAAARAGPAPATDLWPGAAASNAKARSSRWQTVPGAAS